MTFPWRRFYVVGVVIWIAYALLFPTWVGKLYTPDDISAPTIWYDGGVFALRGATDFYKLAPIWSPPTAHSDRIQCSVRWPWQPAHQRACVEIAVARVVARWSVGLLALGLFVRAVSWGNPSLRSDPILSIASHISLSLVIAWVLLIAIAVLTMFYGTTDLVVIGLLSFGLLAGLMRGLIAQRRAPMQPQQKAS